MNPTRYRDRNGRFRRRDGFDVLEDAGACVLIVLLIFVALLA